MVGSKQLKISKEKEEYFLFLFINIFLDNFFQLKINWSSISSLNTSTWENETGLDLYPLHACCKDSIVLSVVRGYKHIIRLGVCSEVYFSLANQLLHQSINQIAFLLRAGINHSEGWDIAFRHLWNMGSWPSWQVCWIFTLGKMVPRESFKPFGLEEITQAWETTRDQLCCL